MLPETDPLFRTYVYAWYDETAVARHPDRVKSDIEEVLLPAGTPIHALHPIDPAVRDKSARQIEQMITAASADLSRMLGARPPLGRHWLDAADAYFDRNTVNHLIQTSDARNFSNAYLLVACELGALIGHLLRTSNPSLQWVYDSPYWESTLFHPPSSTRINVFHWAIRKLSETGIDESLADKTTACLERIEGET